jgi:hypothetical protein
LVYGVLPNEKAILETLKMIRARMVTVQWEVVNEKISDKIK